jgi:RNA polymerase sigma-70 factor (ECF subfamily)
VSGEPERTDGLAQEAGASLLALYDGALPQVYGYLLARCGQAPVAQDLTAETFLAAVKAVKSGAPPDPMSTAWLVGVARHKLADHWRRQGREERKLAAVADDQPVSVDPWDVRLDALRAHATLAQLAPHHRAALTLRYVDDLPVAEVAALLQRSVHATEALLGRAKAAFRRVYCEEDRDD